MTYTSQRGRIDPPQLDDRTWQDLVDEMRALIPKYAPQWTDHNASDIGITLIELFAWLGESIIYRLNQTPVKNYLAFLNLIGIMRAPATPAHTYLTFTSKAGPITVPAGTQAQTPAAAGESVVVFETDEDLAVVPTELKACLLVGPHAAGAITSTYRNATAALVGPPTSRSTITLAPGQSTLLCLGLNKAVTDELNLGVLLSSPLLPDSGATVSWTYSQDGVEPLGWPAVPAARDATETLTRDGRVRVSPPATDWKAQAASPAAAPPTDAWATVTAEQGTEPVTDPLFWVAMKLTNPGASAYSVGFDRLVFNAVMARTALTIRAPEVLGQSTGAPFQVFPLAQQPLFRGTGVEASYDHLTVQVGTGTPPTWETWRLADDLPAGGDRCYRLNPVSGEIMFGNFDSQTHEGHGLVPPAGSQIRALSYRYVATGAAGNVAPLRVTSLGTTPRGALPDGKPLVANLGPGLDGVDEEPVEETLRRAPEELKVRDRAVTVDDFEFLADQISFVKTSRCLTSRRHDSDGPDTAAPVWKKDDPWNFAGICRGPGFVKLIIVPDQPLSVARPEPTAEQITLVTDYFERRRDLTTHLKVGGPLYLPVSVTVDISVWQKALDAGVDVADVKAATLTAIKTFLHPTQGGVGGRGWAVGEPVLGSDVFAAISPSVDIGYVSSLALKAEIPAYHFPPLNPLGTTANWQEKVERPFALGPKSASVRTADYELVCAADDSFHTVNTPTAK